MKEICFTPRASHHLSHFLSLSSPILGGDTVTTCSVTLPTGLTGTPHFLWEEPDGVTCGQMISSDPILSEIVTSQVAQYTCTATLSGTSTSHYIITAVQSLTYTRTLPVPTPICHMNFTVCRTVDPVMTSHAGSTPIRPQSVWVSFMCRACDVLH